jgi:hypothetical protein
VVEDEIYPIVRVVESDPVLPSDKGKAFTKFQEEGLEVVAQKGLQMGLRRTLAATWAYPRPR